jgi:hypothetical protein
MFPGHGSVANKKRICYAVSMDEGRKRVIGIMAAILASLHMQTAPVGSGSCDNLSTGLTWIIADINLLSIDALDIDFESLSETDLLQRVLLCIVGRELAGALSHTNDNSTFFEAHFIHQRFHQVNPTTMNGSGIFGSSRVRYLIQLKSTSFVLYRD